MFNIAGEQLFNKAKYHLATRIWHDQNQTKNADSLRADLLSFLEQNSIEIARSLVCGLEMLTDVTELEKDEKMEPIATFKNVAKGEPFITRIHEGVARPNNREGGILFAAQTQTRLGINPRLFPNTVNLLVQDYKGTRSLSFWALTEQIHNPAQVRKLLGLKNNKKEIEVRENGNRLIVTTNNSLLKPDTRNTYVALGTTKNSLNGDVYFVYGHNPATHRQIFNKRITINI